jgi:hypothetical protein
MPVPDERAFVGGKVTPSSKPGAAPNLDFYASGQDHRDILDYVFTRGEASPNWPTKEVLD